MHISVLTLFPEIVKQVTGSSITGRAWEKDLFSLDLIQIRDFAVNQYGKVDDYCYGGGTGMLMMAEPIARAWLHAVSLHDHQPPQADAASIKKWRKEHADRCLTLFLSPRGQVFEQKMTARLSQVEHLILICGHYEGIDQRAIDLLVDRELSIGDYVLTGGELAACVVMDAIIRLIPGVLPNSEAYTNESHMSGLLEHAQYTRPASWFDMNVPDVLLSGHQANIDQWKESQSLLETVKRRPDLLKDRRYTTGQWQNLLKNWPLKDQE